jgi:nicotinate phosphoribosyltransferase
VALSKSVRAILDRGGLEAVTIFVSGGLDEDSLTEFARQAAPIDGIGIGTAMTTSADVPSVDCVYKLQEYAGLPRRKRSDRKATWPGRKQVWRRYDADGRMIGDTLALDATPSDRADGEPLLQVVMRDGRRRAPSPPLDAVRAHAKRELARLPEALRHLQPGAAYPVTVADELIELAAAVDRHMDRNQAQRGAGRVAQ